MNKVGIIGGSGFAGEELIKFLSSHDSTSLIAVSSRELKGQPVSQFIKESELNFVDPDDEIFFQCDFSEYVIACRFCESTYCINL